MLNQYIKFCINGGLLAIVAWALQLGIYKLIDGHLVHAYAVASCLTYLPLVIINFLIQKSLIFKRHGLFWRFFIANMMIMLLVTGLSQYCKELIDLLWGAPWGDKGGFMLATAIGSTPSFLLKRYWVFNFLRKNYKECD